MIIHLDHQGKLAESRHTRAAIAQLLQVCRLPSSSHVFLFVYSGFLGALGSFVSGSVMGSNMTMGAIQAIAAQRVGVSATSLLAVQVAGACAGKMICVSSILVSE